MAYVELMERIRHLRRNCQTRAYPMPWKDCVLVFLDWPGGVLIHVRDRSFDALNSVNTALKACRIDDISA